MNKLVAAAAAAGISFNSAQSAPLPEARADDVGVSTQRFSKLDEFFAREISPPTKQGSGTLCWCPAASATMGWRSCQRAKAPIFKLRSPLIPHRCLAADELSMGCRANNCLGSVEGAAPICGEHAGTMIKLSEDGSFNPLRICLFEILRSRPKIAEFLYHLVACIAISLCSCD
ncbi:hypothetical protein H8B02_14155 [Bradyrhizobium sp. Pear77]|uniref:hypothetical protein n=1 Tax=Bradyrhizobium TaxID=374 RepID=UPI0035E13804|nr:hypothetical protein [Bradyrhizobium altum]MCC8965504.1 hypothetical protein [Bradyrhizobium oropedii]